MDKDELIRDFALSNEATLISKYGRGCKAFSVGPEGEVNYIASANDHVSPNQYNGRLMDPLLCCQAAARAKVGVDGMKNVSFFKLDP